MYIFKDNQTLNQLAIEAVKKSEEQKLGDSELLIQLMQLKHFEPIYSEADIDKMSGEELDRLDRVNLLKDNTNELMDVLKDYIDNNNIIIFTEYLKFIK